MLELVSLNSANVLVEHRCRNLSNLVGGSYKPLASGKGISEGGGGLLVEKDIQKGRTADYLLISPIQNIISLALT